MKRQQAAATALKAVQDNPLLGSYHILWTVYMWLWQLDMFVVALSLHRI